MRVHDTLGDFLLVRDILQDELLDDQERFDALLMVLYPDPQGVCDALGEDVLGFLTATLWDCFGIDIDGTHEADENRIIDWDEDRDRMMVTARQAYQMGWDHLTQLAYKEACGLMMLAPHETPMGQAVYYRTAKPPKQTKHNAEYVRDWRKARDAYRLHENETTSVERQQAAEMAQLTALMEHAKAAQKHG